VNLVDVSARASRATVPGRWLTAAFSPDGRTLATGSGDGAIALWDHRRLTRVATLRTDPGRALPPAFGGGLMVAGGPAGVRVWDVRRRRPVGPPWRFNRPIASAALNPDGSRLAVGFGGVLEVWDVMRRSRLTRRRVDSVEAGWAAFSPDGRLLVAGGVDGVLTVLATEDWQPVATPPYAHPGALLSATVSADGALIATTGSDGSARLWDAVTLRPVGSPLPSVPNHAASAAFTPDSRRLIVVSDTGEAFDWDVWPPSWARRACDVAGRTLTPREWAEFLPRRPYAPACGTA
jgi:WD40 repeat protein